jgi:hypothetical protein
MRSPANILQRSNKYVNRFPTSPNVEELPTEAEAVTWSQMEESYKKKNGGTPGQVSGLFNENEDISMCSEDWKIFNYSQVSDEKN